MELPQLRDVLEGASAVEYHTGLFPAERPVRRLFHAGLLFTGDAGAQGSTLLGEGIRYAIHSGRIAGDVAAEATASGDVSAGFLARYDDRWRRRYGREMEISYLVGQRIIGYGDEQWDNALDLAGKLSRDQLISLLRGEYSTTLFASILARNPRLMFSGGKKIIDAVIATLTGKS